MPRTIRGRVDTSEERELWWSSVSEDEKWRLRGMIGEDRYDWVTALGHAPCQGCLGSGVFLYPDTTTWRGGVGGQAFTMDVCDACWGSGRHGAPWPPFRAR